VIAIFSQVESKDSIFYRLRHFTVDEVSSLKTTYPTTIANHAVYGVRDLTAGYGYDSSNPPTYLPRLPLSGDQMITFKAKSISGDLAASFVILTIRASGTEPKIKLYLEGCGADTRTTSTLLQQVLDELAQDWLQIDKNGLSVSV